MSVDTSNLRMIDKSVLKKYKIKGRSLEARFHSEVLADYWICMVSRETSLLARKEVLSGKAKFGITGDGKELPQVAWAKAFKKGDWRSGYYRDQTFMMALDECSIEDLLAQLYADPANDPFSGGRQMNSHFASKMIDEEGNWLDQTKMYNVSSDISPTAGQMARGLGLALASKKFRTIKGIGKTNSIHSRNGNEISFVTIGDASTSEGVFWETLNAATVMRVPLHVSVWDDGYGISVPIELQTTKGSISEALEGFRVDETDNGMFIYTVNGWDYPALVKVYEESTEMVRKEHRPALVHVRQLTQPQGHSTSGSHERYKSKDRLEWEKEYDCIKQFGDWMVSSGLVTSDQLEEINISAKTYVKERKNVAWERYTGPIKAEKAKLLSIYKDLEQDDYLQNLKTELNYPNLVLTEVLQNARRLKIHLECNALQVPDALAELIQERMDYGHDTYHTKLYSDSPHAAIKVPIVNGVYTDDSKEMNGYQVLNTFFDETFKRDNRVMAFGEDVGYIGDVNQGFAGLQEKYGIEKVFDTGIREWTIMGQAIGLAMRGFRPIAEIQYLDYLLYGLEPLSDDLATLRYRSNGQQQAPAIIRTRGHRLEGIWHAGSPLGMMIHALRGMYICVPRNMVQAVGFYNTLLRSDDPGIVIECLNGYRLKETLPDNYLEMTVPLGIPEVIREGTDVTLVTYGSSIRVAEKGIQLLEKRNISVELIDVRTLLPFDLENIILESIKKTNKVVFMDEDVPGGSTSYMIQKVIEENNGYRYLDAAPLTLTAKEHRTPFGSDGDYFTKPNPEDVYDIVSEMMSEYNPQRFA